MTGNNSSGNGFAFANFGFIDTGAGNDIITGSNIDEVDGILGNGGFGLLNGGEFDGFIYTGDGNDTITGITTATNNGIGLINSDTYTIDTGNGNDIITGTGSAIGITNDGTINTGNGEDSIISQGKLLNRGGAFLGEGNDSIIASIMAEVSLPNRTLENFNAIETGDGDDTITSTGVIYNEGIINTGNGDDSIIVDGGIDDITGNTYSIYNNGGAINMGDGNDSIIANQGFESGLNR